MSKKTKARPILLLCLAVLFLIAVAVAVLVPKKNTSVSLECFAASFNVERFLTALEKQDYSKAFARIYCYQDDLEKPVSELDSDRLEEIWTARVEGLRTGIKQIYLTDHSGLSVYTEDGVMKGRVTLTLMEQGHVRTYETDLVFVSDGGWRLAGVSDEIYLTLFEEAVSGAFTAEELSQEAA